MWKKLVGARFLSGQHETAKIRTFDRGRVTRTRPVARSSRSFQAVKLRLLILLFVTGCRRYRRPATSVTKLSMLRPPI